jgi:hypothetical protein
MVDRSAVRLALLVVTEGSAAPERTVPRIVRSHGFAIESFGAEAEAIAEESRPWVTGSGIQGVGIGQKITGGRATGELALRVYVDRKQPVGDIDNAVPERVALPSLAVPTDVIEIGRLDLELFTDRLRPIVPGIGVSLEGGPPGTIGGFVRRREGGQLLLVSNSHVLADNGRAERGSPIVQPGHADAPAVGSAAGGDDVIGTLADFVPFDWAENTFPNRVDAALATVDVDHENVIRLLGAAPRGVNHRPRVGMRVQKVGRTSDHTIGLITDTDFRVQIPYPHPDGGKRRVGFRDQVLCSRYTSPGDSGSLVLSSTGLAVGLHFAGSSSASVFSRIGDVLDAFDVDLLTGGHEDRGDHGDHGDRDGH